MKEIKLRNSNLVALVDDEDFERIGHFKWYAENHGHTFYAMRAFRNPEKRRTDHKRMHREILGTSDRKIVTDHIDHNGLNNQRANLRVCTQGENLRNTRLRKCNTTGFKGVSPHIRSSVNPFRARITFNRKEIVIGYYPTAEIAAKAYNLKAKELYGEFANLNPV